MPKQSPHPHVIWRNGRPRFSPDQVLRKMGFAGQDLRHEDGRWFSKGEAVDWSVKFQAQLREKRLAMKRPATPPARPTTAVAPIRQIYSVARMLEDWKRSPKWREGQKKSLSLNTRRDYEQKLRVLEEDHPLIWNAPAHLIRRTVLRQAYEQVWAKRGLATARGVMLVLSSAYSWATLAGKVKREDNPARKLQMEVPDPRVRFATRKELAALVATADAIGRPEIGDAIVLGVWTGQRQADRLAMLAGQKLNGRRVFRQAKTGAIVWVKEAPELEQRLEAASRRRARAKAEALLAASPAERKAIEERFAHVVLDEAIDTRMGRGWQRWLPFGKYHYPHIFAEVRAAAVEGVKAGDGSWLVEPCPSLADLRDQDLRDTSVTWQGLAGATIPEIISVTGHTAESATTILKHYLARHPEMADSAIGKMIAWYDGNGETEFGL